MRRGVPAVQVQPVGAGEGEPRVRWGGMLGGPGCTKGYCSPLKKPKSGRFNPTRVRSLPPPRRGGIHRRHPCQRVAPAKRGLHPLLQPIAPFGAKRPRGAATVGFSMASPIARATGWDAPWAALHGIAGVHRGRGCTARRLRGRARTRCPPRRVNWGRRRLDDRWRAARVVGSARHGG